MHSKLEFGFWCLSLFVLCAFVTFGESSRGSKLGFDEFQKLFENGERLQRKYNSQKGVKNEQQVTLISFLQKAVKQHGEKKVANSIYELAQRSLYDLVWLLGGDLEPWLIYDLYKMYNAANSDPAVLSVYERFRAGQVNRSIVPEVFSLDKKYNELTWYKRVRGRMLENVDKYIAGNLQLTNPPPKIEFGPDGKPIIEGKPETVVASAVPSVVSTGKKPNSEDGDEDGEDSDLDDIFEGFFD